MCNLEDEQLVVGVKVGFQIGVIASTRLSESEGIGRRFSRHRWRWLPFPTMTSASATISLQHLT